ncbi:MAG: tetratricopeptide repeat protein [Bacteroidales bacterium]|jgi:tetratricopeptide (TPR) repeat protein|nr:tetratricopeptide repeat protein [Bacteroidales bacterium]
MKRFFIENWDNVWFKLFLVISAVILAAMIWMAQDAGNSGDEDSFQIPQGNYVLDYYKSGGKDTTCFSFNELMVYYGASFDVITAFVVRTFDIENVASARHATNALFGWLCILFAALTAYAVGGWRAGVFTLLLMFFSPRLLGHSFNNPKDIPFAAAVTMALFFMVRFVQRAPKVKWHNALCLALSIALAISVRVGGLILFGFFGLFGVVWLIKYFTTKENKATTIKTPNKKASSKEKSPIGTLLLWAVGIVIVGYFGGLILWPYAMKAPLKNPFEAMKLMSNFSVAIRQLYEGSLQWSDVLPWYYTPKYILTTIPIAVIIGALLYPFLSGKKKENRFTTFMLYFALIFPIFWIVYSKANVYGGWRHAMFAYPPMVVCAGLGFNSLVELVKNKYAKWAFSALPLALLIMPILFIVKNHPYEYVYFNTLGGGTEKAYGNYEMDYYYNSTREATEWIIKNAEKSGLETGDKIRVASWHTASVGYFLRNDTARFQNTFSRWYEKGNNDWDYAIFVITGIPPEQIKNKEIFPPKNCVHTITVDGQPICIILKRTDKSDMKGFQLKEAHQNDSALVYLEKAVVLDPTNEAALANTAEIYLQTGQLEKAKSYIDLLIKVSPKYETANFFLAHYYLAQNKSEEALQVCKQIINDNFKFRAAYNLMCNIYLRMNNIKDAEKILLKMLDADQMDDQGSQQLFEIFKAGGLDERAAYKKLMKKFYLHYEKTGNATQAELYKAEYKKL